uniref:F-box/WD-40 repeat-containing protein 1 n=1 Tax=Fragaria vesca subsp. vesca TaxID=101020 RepID=UPI0005C8D4D1|nr:PREDICTED: F-box/WD-40 repeat-containing protein 1 [Fragaria vesca subsp. vesca]
MVFFSCIPIKPYRFLRKRCRSSSIKSSTNDSRKLSAKDPSEFSSRSGDIHNQNLSQNPATYEAVQELPFDIITEILSWLPVESLLRFKCVCKNWRSLLGDYKFIAKHMARARSHQLSCQRIVEPTASPTKQVTTFLYAEKLQM